MPRRKPDMKLVVNHDLPLDHPDHEKLVPLTKTELKQQERDRKRSEKREKQAEEERANLPINRLARAVEGAETFDDLKAALLDFTKGDT